MKKIILTYPSGFLICFIFSLWYQQIVKHVKKLPLLKKVLHQVMGVESSSPLPTLRPPIPCRWSLCTPPPHHHRTMTDLLQYTPQGRFLKQFNNLIITVTYMTGKTLSPVGGYGIPFSLQRSFNFHRLPMAVQRISC